jgi:NAD(P)-dependent dehydrogenase (short-subunit alcohol dehydrogenase family)
MSLAHPLGRIALVTGAGSGIGAAVARQLYGQGFCLGLMGRRLAPLQALVEPWDPQRYQILIADVTDEGQVDRAFADLAGRYRRLDVLFNNAGVFAAAAPIDDLPLALWRQVIDTNLTGAFLCTRAAMRLMKSQSPRGGRIINNGSISAQVPRPMASAYTASKFALTGLTRATALEGRAFDIACGQIDIGNAATDMTGAMAQGILQADGGLRPEARMDVADAARAVVYMASLPLSANVLSMTVMATAMPFVGRG